MSKKERSFDVELQELSDNNWNVQIASKSKGKSKAQIVAHINKKDSQHYEIETLTNHAAPKVVTNSLESALNSAIMQFNLHLH